MIARAVVGECNFSTSNCPSGVMHTLTRRWKRAKLLRAARGNHKTFSLALQFFLYCSIFKGPHVGRKRWVRTLPDYPGPPDGWPTTASWANNEPDWHRIYLQAGLFLRGLVPDPCDGETIHTGGRMDRARMSPAKWREVDCGDTGRGVHRQFFWEAK